MANIFDSNVYLKGASVKAIADVEKHFMFSKERRKPVLDKIADGSGVRFMSFAGKEFFEIMPEFLRFRITEVALLQEEIPAC